MFLGRGILHPDYQRLPMMESDGTTCSTLTRRSDSAGLSECRNQRSEHSFSSFPFGARSFRAGIPSTMAGGKAGTVEVDMPAGVLDMDGNRTGATVDDRCSNSISADARTTTEEAAAAALADSTLRPPKLTIATHSTYNDDVAYDGTKMASCAARQRPPAPLLFHADSGLGVASALKLSLDTQASLLKDSLSQPSLSHTSGGLGCNGGDDAVDRDGNDGNDDGELAIAPPATLSPAPFMRSFSVVRRPEELSIHPTSHSIPMDGTLENAVTSTVVADSASESHAVRHRQTQPRPQVGSVLRASLLSDHARP